MSHFFCHSCGAKLSYVHAKPNFCGKCGEQIATTVSANTAEGLPPLQESVVISKDETDATSVPSITNFEVEYENGENKTMTLGSLMGKATAPDSAKTRRGAQSIGEFIDEKKKEG
jgi:hypothetical protein